MRPPEAPVRTVVLATIAAVLAIVWLARSFEIETGELTGFFLMSLALVAGIAILAALFVAITKIVRPGRSLQPRVCEGVPRRRKTGAEGDDCGALRTGR